MSTLGELWMETLQDQVEVVILECTFLEDQVAGSADPGRFRGDPHPWYYILVGNRLLGLSTWRSALSTWTAGDLLIPLLIVPPILRMIPCPICFGFRVCFLTNPAAATLDDTTWRRAP